MIDLTAEEWRVLYESIDLAGVLRQHLPDKYSIAIEIILASLTPPLVHTAALHMRAAAK